MSGQGAIGGSGSLRTQDLTSLITVVPGDQKQRTASITTRDGGTHFVSLPPTKSRLRRFSESLRTSIECHSKKLFGAKNPQKINTTSLDRSSNASAQNTKTKMEVIGKAKIFQSPFGSKLKKVVKLAKSLTIGSTAEISIKGHQYRIIPSGDNATFGVYKKETTISEGGSKAAPLDKPLLGQTGGARLFHLDTHSKLTEEEQKAEWQTKTAKEYANAKIVAKWPHMASHSLITDIRTDEKIILTEYCNKGDLGDFIDKEPKTKMSLLAQAADGFAFMHTGGFCHLDIKPDSILIKSSHNQDGKEQLEAKISNLREMKEIGYHTTTDETANGQTPEFSAENLLDTQIQDFTPKMDVFSFGLTMYQMMKKENPPNLDFKLDKDNSMKKLQDMRAKLTLTLNLDSPDFEPSPLDKLIARCLDPDPEKRPDMQFIATSLRHLNPPET